MTVLNVKNSPFNAAGDGATDDRLAIQAALDAWMPGDEVYLPAGDYLIGPPPTPYAALLAPAGITFYGDGVGKSEMTLSPYALPETKLFELENYSTQNTVTDLTFHGNGALKDYDAEGELLHGLHVSRSRFQRLEFYGAVSEGIDLDFPDHCLIEDVYGEDCGGDLIHGGANYSAIYNRVHRVTAVNCAHRRADAGASEAYAIHLSGDVNSFVDVMALNCANGVGTIQGFGSRIIGAYVEGGEIGIHGGGALVQSCVTKGCNSRGIVAAESAIGNTILGEGVTNVGIGITSTDAIASDNRIYGCQYNGIAVTSPNALNGSLTGNIIFGSAQYAVHFNSNQTGWVVDNNAWNGSPVLLPTDVFGTNRA